MLIKVLDKFIKKQSHFGRHSNEVVQKKKTFRSLVSLLEFYKKWKSNLKSPFFLIYCITIADKILKTIIVTHNIFFENKQSYN